jgi:hypothetical protein
VKCRGANHFTFFDPSCMSRPRCRLWKIIACALHDTGLLGLVTGVLPEFVRSWSRVRCRNMSPTSARLIFVMNNLQNIKHGARRDGHMASDGQRHRNRHGKMRSCRSRVNVHPTGTWVLQGPGCVLSQRGGSRDETCKQDTRYKYNCRVDFNNLKWCNGAHCRVALGGNPKPRKGIGKDQVRFLDSGNFFSFLFVRTIDVQDVLVVSEAQEDAGNVRRGRVILC